MKKKHLRVIQEIQGRIPKELLSRLTRIEIQAPAIKKVMEHALTLSDEEVSPRKKRRYRALLDSGRLDREVEVLDHEVEKEIDDFMKKEIDLAVRLGRLPDKAPMLDSLKTKGKKYARKQEARLRREFLGEDSSMDSDPEDSRESEEERETRKSDGGVLLEPGQ